MGRDGGVSTDDVSGQKRRLILNPTSGRGEDVAEVRRLASDHRFPVVATERAGHAVELAREAVTDGVELLAVYGGDGTLHEVVEGIVAADALDAVTVCVVPGGTENIVATHLGVETLSDGFEVAVRGETRRLDVGMAGDDPFVMSAIAGLPADVSAAATNELKSRFGSFAFVIGGVEEGLSFDGLDIEIDATVEGEEFVWAGEALCVLVGNLRRFAGGGGQANAEDGLLEVTIVEEMPTTTAVVEAVEQRLFGDDDTPHVTELHAESLEVVGREDQPVTFSLDGEIRRFDELRMGVLPRALSLRVGSAYDPTPVDE